MRTVSLMIFFCANRNLFALLAGLISYGAGSLAC